MREWRPLPNWASDYYRRHLARTGHYLDAHMVKAGDKWRIRRSCCPQLPHDDGREDMATVTHSTEFDPWDTDRHDKE